MHQIAKIYHYIIQHNSRMQIAPRLLLAFCYQLYKRIIKKPLIKKLFNGKKIWLFPDNPICSAFVYSAIPDKAEILALRQLVDSNTIFLDIGANIGAYSILLSDKVNLIYAFEAHPETARYCKMNFTLNGIAEQNVIQMAVSDNNAPTYFSNGTGGCPLNTIQASSAEAIQVPAITLDDFMAQQAFPPEATFLLKIDVEGFEHAVFSGAKNFLKNQQILGMIFETFSHNNHAIMNLLTEVGFSITQISQHNMLAVRKRPA